MELRPKEFRAINNKYAGARIKRKEFNFYNIFFFIIFRTEWKGRSAVLWIRHPKLIIKVRR